MRRAKQLECITIAYLLSVIGLMYAVMGSSQAMQTAWIEDLLSLVPPIGFLIAARIRYRAPNPFFPFGYHRAVNIAYFTSAIALLSVGMFLFIESLIKLVTAEHPTIGAITIFGETVWLGWLMFPVLVWSVIPAYFLGRAKIGIAERLHDKPLYADASMNKADWLTGVSAGTGILGIAFGYWWMDAVAAIVISVDIIWDGIGHLKNVVGDLMDRAPKTVDRKRYLDLPEELSQAITQLPGVRDVAIRLREEGHVLNGDAFVFPEDSVDLLDLRLRIIEIARGMDWRMHEITVQFVGPEECSLTGENG